MLAGAAVFDWLFSFLLFDDAAYAELSSFDERMFMLVLRVVCAAVGACLALSAVTVRVIVPLVREARALKEAKRSAEALRAARKAWRKAHGVSRQTAEDDGGEAPMRPLHVYPYSGKHKLVSKMDNAKK